MLFRAINLIQILIFCKHFRENVTHQREKSVNTPETLGRHNSEQKDRCDKSPYERHHVARREIDVAAAVVRMHIALVLRKSYQQFLVDDETEPAPQGAGESATDYIAKIMDAKIHS